RSGLTSPALGRNLGLHPVRLVYGLFDEPQDAHMVFPITAHSMAHQHDEDGGFVIEATTIQDPIAFATTLRDETGPLWGQPLVDGNGESHEVKRLFVGDASLIPRTLSVNPSLTIMALATRLADHVAAA